MFKLLPLVLLATSASVFAEGSSPAPADSKVFLAVIRTPHHRIRASEAAWTEALTTSDTHVKQSGVRRVFDPVRGTFVTDQCLSLISLIRIARDVNATELWRVTVDRPLWRWQRLTIDAYDLHGARLWSKRLTTNGPRRVSLAGLVPTYSGLKRTLMAHSPMQKAVPASGSGVQSAIAGNISIGKPIENRRTLSGQAVPLFILKERTQVRLLLAQDVDGATAKSGDPVEFILARNLRAQGELVARAGARVIGRVRGAERPMPFGYGGKLAIELEAIRSGDQVIPLRGLVKRKGKDHELRTFMVGSLLGVQAMLFSRGGAPKLREGIEVVAEVAEKTAVQPLSCSASVC